MRFIFKLDYRGAITEATFNNNTVVNIKDGTSLKDLGYYAYSISSLENYFNEELYDHPEKIWKGFYNG